MEKQIIVSGRAYVLKETGEIRFPKKGEFFFCRICDEIEVCLFPEECPTGKIYEIT